MVLHRAHTVKATYNNFKCYTYNKRGKDVCSAHYLRDRIWSKSSSTTCAGYLIVYRDVGVMDSMKPVESGEQEFYELTEQAENAQKTT